MSDSATKISLERTLTATIDDVWELWTTKSGLESWWGPEGFSVAVHSLDLRPGGELRYAMSATGPEQIDFMKRAGMSVTTEAKVTFRAIEPKHRLSYEHLTDFIPNVAPYSVTTQLELTALPNGVHLLLTLDPMHDEVWSERARLGWESELGKLAAIIDRRTPR